MEIYIQYQRDNADFSGHGDRIHFKADRNAE